MPLPVAIGALSEAYRILCARCLRLRGKNPDHICEFLELGSKKCGYCTSQKSSCEPIPYFCGPEYHNYVDALEAGDAEGAETERLVLVNIMAVAAAEVPKKEDELASALLRENRAFHHEVLKVLGTISGDLVALMLVMQRGSNDLGSHSTPAKRGVKNKAAPSLESETPSKRVRGNKCRFVKKVKEVIRVAEDEDEDVDDEDVHEPASGGDGGDAVED